MNNKKNRTPTTKEIIGWVWPITLLCTIIIAVCVVVGIQSGFLPRQGSDALLSSEGKILVGGGGVVWTIVLGIILLCICAISDGYYWTKPVDESPLQIVMGKVMSIVPGVGLFLLAWTGTYALGNAMVSSPPHIILWWSIGFPVVLLGTFVLLSLFLMPGIILLQDKLEGVDWTRLLSAHAKKTKC